MKDFDKWVMEQRIRQSNIRWLVKEIILGIVVGFFLYMLISSQS